MGFIKDLFSGMGKYIVIGLGLGIFLFLSGFLYFYTAKIEEAAISKQTIVTLNETIKSKTEFIESIEKLRKKQEEILNTNRQQIELQNSQIETLERQLIMKPEASEQAAPILKEYFRGIK